MAEKTINLIPEEWRPVTTPSAVPSLLVTAIIAVGLTVLGTTLPAEAERGSPSPVMAPGPRPVRDRVLVHTDDDTARSLSRASAWYPWTEFLSRVPELIREESRLTSVSYSRDTQRLVLSGETAMASYVSKALKGLEDFDWIQDPQPDIEPTGSGLSRFAIEADVVPLLELEASR